MALFKPTYTALADEKLMALVARKDSQAFDVLYSRYGRLMYNYFHRMLWKDREKARDFTQDLFLQINSKNLIHLMKVDHSKHGSTALRTTCVKMNMPKWKFAELHIKTL